MAERKVFFIYSGKGGVGKSTITYNLAYALKKTGKTVAILDLDLKTPSIYKLFSHSEHITKPFIHNMKIKPAEVDGILVQSTGFINQDTGLFLNDDLVEGALYQLLHSSLYQVDYLLIDMPPSVEKIHSLICREFREAEFLLVSTYSLLSLEDTQKAYNFILKLDHKIRRIVFNMAYIVCPNCQEKLYLFNKENLKRFPDLSSLKFVEIPFSKNMVDINEHSKSIFDSQNQGLYTSFQQILKTL